MSLHRAIPSPPNSGSPSTPGNPRLVARQPGVPPEEHADGLVIVCSRHGGLIRPINAGGAHRRGPGLAGGRGGSAVTARARPGAGWAMLHGSQWVAGHPAVPGERLRGGSPASTSGRALAAMVVPLPGGRRAQARIVLAGRQGDPPSRNAGAGCGDRAVRSGLAQRRCSKARAAQRSGPTEKQHTQRITVRRGAGTTGERPTSATIAETGDWPI